MLWVGFKYKEKSNNMYHTLTPEEIQGLVDGEYYWILYMFPSDSDERLEVGKYCKAFQQFDLCEGKTITPDYVHEVHMVKRPI